MVQFELGTVTMSDGVFNKAMEDLSFAMFVLESLELYKQGKWGASELDSKLNDWAVECGDYISTGYNHLGQPIIWIITKQNRSATTILFPHEYGAMRNHIL